MFIFQQKHGTSTRDYQMNDSRLMSSMQTQQPGPLPEVHIDPYRLLEDDLKDVYDDIRQVNIFFICFLETNIFFFRLKTP